MSDNLRRYRAIRDALTPWYPGQPSGTVARHLIPLAALISGIVGSQSTQLPHIAAKVPNGTTPESRVKRLARWFANAHVLEEVYFLPYADVLLHHLAWQTVVLVMDGSGVGRGCTALMIHVVYKGRALPLAWRVRQAPKGHFPEELPIALVTLISELIPTGAQVVLLGDGECDGTQLQQTLQQAGGSSACRTATRTVATWAGRNLPPGCARCVSQAGEAERVERGPRHTTSVWSHHGAGLLGQGGSRAAVFGQQYGHRRGSVSLVRKALPHRDLFF
jgi:hypothetical protein